MRIGVNISSRVGNLEGYSNYLIEIFYRLGEDHAEHQSIFIVDEPTNSSQVLPPNVSTVVVPRKSKDALSLKWWYDVKVPFALKRNKVDLFITINACSLTSNISQLLLIDDLSFLHYPKFTSAQFLFLYKTYTPKFLKKAKAVVTTSEFLSKEISKRFAVSDTINIKGFADAVFRPVSWEEREAVKNKYADACEYFVFVGGFDAKGNLLNLLKAFSLFKIRQRSSIKLLVVNEGSEGAGDIQEKLKSYKFKDEVKLINKLSKEEYTSIIASAYALVHPSFYEGFAISILQAMRCEVPVITTNSSSMQEIGNDAVLYANPTDPADIAEQLKLIFKDENLRRQLIERGKTEALKYSIENTTAKMWQAIEKAV